MAKIENKPIELRGRERVFQIDRDTYLVYTGRDKNDLRPFVRVGAGDTIPRGCLGQIENVILLENNPVNIAQELNWLKSTFEEVNLPIHYVGSRDRVSQIYNLTGMPDIDDEDDRPVKMDPYAPMLKGSQIPRDKCTVQFFENGNAQLSVGSSRVFDYLAMTKSRNNIDKEYDQISSAMHSLPKKCSAKEIRSFQYLGRNAENNPLKPSIYWNFHAHGVLLNPVPDQHQILFENKIDPKSIDAVISNSILTVGMAESFRRKNILAKELAIYSADTDRQNILKKIYSSAKIKNIQDGSVIPGIKNTFFFISRKGSHGSFGYKIKDESDKVAQILFPIGGAKFSQKFDFIKAPHDLEIMTCYDKNDLKNMEYLANLVLVLPGKMETGSFAKNKVAQNLYPLVPKKEYKLIGFTDNNAMVESFIQAFEKTTIKDFVKELLFAHLGLDCTEQTISNLLTTIYQFDVITDPVKLNNLGVLLAYLKTLPAYQTYYNKENLKLLQRCQKKFNIRNLSFKNILDLETRDIEFAIVFCGGESSWLLIMPSEMEPAVFRCPPEIEAFEKNPKEYKRFLTRQNRNVDKIGDIPGYRQCLDYLEKLNDESLQIVEERKRFKNLSDILGMVIETKSEPKQPSFFARFWQSVTGFWDQSGNWLKYLLGGVLAVLTIGIIVGLFWLIFSDSPDLKVQTANGNSLEEQKSTTLVDPGKLQTESMVPGEQEVQTPLPEILIYANALATRNGFRKLNQRDQNNLKNPDLVFPGDQLKLPDGRIAQVRPKDYIWELAQTHYKKDFARLQILQKKMNFMQSSLDSQKDGTKKSEMQKQLTEIKKYINRLAVTPEMKKINKI